MAEGTCHQMGRRFLRFATCDSLLTQTVRTLSFPCKGTSKKLGTCSGFRKMTPRRSLVCCSRHEGYVRDFDYFIFFNTLLVFLANNLVLAGNRKWIELPDFLVLIVFKVAVGQISVVFCNFFLVVECFIRIFGLGPFKIPEQTFKGTL